MEDDNQDTTEHTTPASEAGEEPAREDKVENNTEEQEPTEDKPEQQESAQEEQEAMQVDQEDPVDAPEAEQDTEETAQEEQKEETAKDEETESPHPPPEEEAQEETQDEKQEKSEEPPLEESPAEEPPAEEPSTEEPPVEEPPAEEPPVEEPPTEEPPEPTEAITVNGNGVMSEDDLYSHMSTKAEIVDVDALRGAIADVRSDNNGVNRKSWVVAGHVDNTPNLVEVKSQDTSEEANLDDFAQLLEDDQVMYALIRITATVDMSATVKFVYVHWVGEQVPFAKRGRYGVVHGSVEHYFNPYHIVIETGNREELTEEELLKMLGEKNMTVSKVVETPTDARHERGFTQHQQKRVAPSHAPKAVAPAGNQVEVSPELNEAIGEVRDDSSDVTWLLAGYEDNNIKKQLVVVNKGSGGIEDLKEHLSNENVQYGLLRTSDTYDEIKTVKFVYIYWIGEEVKPMTKGKVYANTGPVEQIFSPIHVSVSFTNTDEISDEVINDKVSAGSGSKSFVK